MKSTVLLQFIPFCLVVLASGNNLADFFSSLNHDKSEDTTRIVRGLRSKHKVAKLPLAFSKIMTGEDIVEEMKYECKDKMDENTCKEWASADVCVDDPHLMKEYCAKTCKLCVERPAPAPVACQLTPNGCCWDGVTEAEGPNQEGCPACLTDKYSALCKRFHDYCLLKGRNREWIRQNCPETCIKLWKYNAEKTFPEDELKENVVYNAWNICYARAKGARRDLETLLEELHTQK